MDVIGEAIGQALGGLLDNPIVGLVVRLVVAYVVLVWLVAALWAFMDMRRRSQSLIAAYLTAGMTILASPLLFPLALIVHRVLRPAGFLSERQLSELRSAALDAETVGERCPECQRPVEPDWLVCPACRRALGHRCHRCGGTVALDWPVCAWCGQDLDGAPGPRAQRRGQEQVRSRARA
jgi:hypothetical protein